LALDAASSIADWTVPLPSCLGLLGSLFRLLGGLPGGYVLSDRALLRLPNLSFGSRCCWSIWN